jgi:voltage-gated potassium channel
LISAPAREATLTGHEGRITWLRRHKYLVLVATLSCLYIGQSTAHGVMGGRLFSDILAALIMLAVLLVVFELRRDRIVALVVAAVTILSSSARYVLLAQPYNLQLTVIHYLLLTVFLGYAVAVILGNIFEKSAVGADDVLGAVSGYLIAGAAWSSLYALTDILSPESFTLAPPFAALLSDWHGRTSVFNYFSLVTLTTVGYGDVTPTHAPATAFAMLEAVFGQFYIAVVVAQLVSARMTGGVRQDSGE